MAKFYQHINSDDPLFQKTTKLLYVDDSDPDLLLYVFDDGSKCSAEFVAKIDDMNANNGMYHMVEVESPVNIWRFKSIELKPTNLNAKTADGQDVEVPDPYFVGLSGNNSQLNGGGLVKEGIRWESRSPRPAVRPIDDINEYFGSYIKYAVENNVKINKDINTDLVMEAMSGKLDEAIKNNASQPVINTAPTEEPKIEPTTLKTSMPIGESAPEIKVNTPKKEPVSVFQETKKQLIINADELINSNDYDIVKLTFNGEEKEIDIKKFFTQAIEEQKVVEVQAETHTSQGPVTLAADDIEIDIINTPEWELINNMINMSQKEECSIDIELILSLPPVDVYRLIKTAYPKGLSDAFVKTIANRMPIKELRLALAQGLLSYYDTPEELTEFVEEVEPVKEKPVSAHTAEKKVVKKPRTKKSQD
jgi:hypothetical protein